MISTKLSSILLYIKVCISRKVLKGVSSKFTKCQKEISTTEKRGLQAELCLLEASLPRMAEHERDNLSSCANTCVKKRRDFELRFYNQNFHDGLLHLECTDDDILASR